MQREYLQHEFLINCLITKYQIVLFRFGSAWFHSRDFSVSVLKLFKGSNESASCLRAKPLVLKLSRFAKYQKEYLKLLLIINV